MKKYLKEKLKNITDPKKRKKLIENIKNRITISATHGGYEHSYKLGKKPIKKD